MIFRPFTLYIGLRYTRAKRRNHFISFISLTSMLGMALGITALITVLSVMNGFDHEIRSRILGMARQVSLESYSGKLSNWNKLINQVKENQEVLHVAPYVSGQALLTHFGQPKPAYVVGVDPAREAEQTDIAKKMVFGSWDALKTQKFGVVIGQTLANNLGLRVGEKTTLLIPEMTVTPVNIMPRYKRFTVVGIFHVGNGFGYDSSLAYINLSDAQKLFRLGNAVTGLRLQLHDVYKANQISLALSTMLGDSYNIFSWTKTYGALFSAIALEKTMMFLMLLLIVAVAMFNLLSTLVMAVTDKQADIAILRTLGATPREIMTIFVVQGAAIGFVGIILGIIGGIWLALNVTGIVNWIQGYFHLQLLSSNVYYVNFLPSLLKTSDVVHVCIAAILMSLLATLYPAWNASRVQPAEALRYE